MCFGRKEKTLYKDDEAPRPPAGYFPEQPTYATMSSSSEPPKASLPPHYTAATAYAAPSASPMAPQPPPPVELPAAEAHGNDFAPPPGPPPSHTAPPPKHDWESAVPDTALFPPPPALFSGFYQSPTSNASEAEAEAGEAWCAQYPLSGPMALDEAGAAALRAHNPRLMAPVAPSRFRGSVQWTGPGRWAGRTAPDSGDSCIIGYPPLYCAREHGPLAVKTVYYEVVARRFVADATIALGFTALPYPSFRMPGWHRGSLAVHGDDGHKYINDRWGGKAFTAPFRPGETYGIGMTFRRRDAGTGIDVDVFFTRQGREDARWDLHEETDAQEDLPVTGLEGYHDLSCAIGTYKGTEFDVIFDPAQWRFRPPHI